MNQMSHFVRWLRETAEHLLIGAIAVLAVLAAGVVLIGGIIAPVFLVDYGHYVWAVISATPLVLLFFYFIGRSIK